MALESAELAWVNIVSGFQPGIALCSRVHLVKSGDSFGCHNVCRRVVAGIYWLRLGIFLNSVSVLLPLILYRPVLALE